MISDEIQSRMREIVGRYPSARSAMLPCLHLVQREQGYVTPEGIAAVAEVIGVKADEVESVVTFYSMYSEQPLGKHVLKVCTSISCYLSGCDQLIEHFSSRLGIAPKQTTPDGLFTLQGVECLAACGMAPVMQVNDAFVENVTPEMADELIERLRAGEDSSTITSRWRSIADGAGMATRTTFAGQDEDAQATRTTRAKEGR